VDVKFNFFNCDAFLHANQQGRGANFQCLRSTEREEEKEKTYLYLSSAFSSFKYS